VRLKYTSFEIVSLIADSIIIFVQTNPEFIENKLDKTLKNGEPKQIEVSKTQQNKQNENTSETSH